MGSSNLFCLFICVCFFESLLFPIKNVDALVKSCYKGYTGYPTNDQALNRALKIDYTLNGFYIADASPPVKSGVSKANGCGTWTVKALGSVAVGYFGVPTSSPCTPSNGTGSGGFSYSYTCCTYNNCNKPPK